MVRGWKLENRGGSTGERLAEKRKRKKNITKIGSKKSIRRGRTKEKTTSNIAGQKTGGKQGKKKKKSWWAI